MKRKTIIYSLFILAGVIAGLQAQNQTKQLTGVVTDAATGEPLTGATIRIQGTSGGTTSDVNGKYSIEVSAPLSVLVFSFIGYQTQELQYSGAGTMNVALESDAKMLDAVVAIGYGTTTKKEITGAVSSLQAEDLNRGTFTNAAGLMQGRIAGLTVTNASGGDPSAQYEILLRGNNTLMAKRDPLIIIDGVADADIRNINFQEVETIDVLKDGSAAAIYGSRGTNGVIIITTKRAHSGTTRVEYDGQVSFQKVTRRAEPLSAEDFADVINNFKPSSAGNLYGASTDWFEEVTRSPVSHKHLFAISGGTKIFSHRTVLNVEQNQGIQQKNNAGKYLFKTNIRQSILGGWLDLDYNATLSKRKYTPANNDIFRQAFFHNPTEPVYDPSNSKYGGYFTVQNTMDYYNPVAMLRERMAQYQNDFMEFNGRATLNIIPVDGLKWDNFISYKQERFNSKIYRTHYYPSIVGSDGEADIENTYSNQLQWESTVQYSHDFASLHSLQVLAGYTFLQGYDEGSSMYNQGYDFDIWLADNIGVGTGLVDGNGGLSSYKSSHRYISFFGRAIYNYDERYIASVSLRRDGSSKFGTNHKWGWFPAASIGWRINRESFLRGVKWLNDLKIRAGYGVTGNEGFGSYKSLLLMGGNGYVLSGGKWVNVYVPVQNANRDLRWEKKSEWNAGIDFSFLNNRLSGAVDYYMRDASDLLYEYEVSSPPWDYRTLFTNVGKLSNTGVEVLITGIPVRTKGFEWITTLTMAHNKNKLISFTNEEFYNAISEVGWIGDPINAYCQKLTEGGTLGSFFAPEYAGTGSDGQEIISVIKIKNVGSAYPDLTLGWSNTFTYKGFDLNIMIRAAIGGKIFNSYRAGYENITTLGLRNILSSWTDNTNFTGNVKYSEKYIEDATYMKIDNISLGYNFNVKKILQSVRFYFAAQNILCLTNYKGVDPEVSLSGLSPGIESTSYYPRTAVFTIGTHLTF